MLNTTDIHAFGELLATPKKIVALAHVNPDGDAIGACLALKHSLKAREHQIEIVAPNRFPDFLHWMEGASDIIIYKDEPRKAQQLLTNADIVVCIDFNNLQRLDELGTYVLGLPAIKVLIDHHLEPDSSTFKFMFWNVGSCSAAELVYLLLKGLHYEDTISPVVASAIYAGIMTDTNDFRNNCSNPRTFETVAELIRTGIDKDLIHSKIYDNYSEDRLRLLGYALQEKLVVIPGYRAAYIALSRKELDKFNYQIGDTEGFVNFPLSIKGIVLSAFFAENHDNIRLSFRSKGEFSVNEFARAHFFGGGHKNAAGGKLNVSLDEAVALFRQSLQEYKDELLDA